MLEKLLESHIRQGTLELEHPDGRRQRFGRGRPQVLWRINNAAAIRKIAMDPEFMLGQTYMDGMWDVAQGTISDLLEILMRNFPEEEEHGFKRLLTMAMRPIQQWNRTQRSRRNVAHHYDLDEFLFRHFLDADMQYSCAYFTEGVHTLEQAQRAKLEHIRRKLQLEPGQKVLDIGCGWGGMAIYLAENAGVSVTGLTLSEEQHRVARQRVRERGLEGKVDIRLEDYRDHQDHYDRVVSVGMFEHVGAPYYETYFRKVRSLLPDDGIALIHTIGRTTPPGTTNPWIRKYIFPGGYVPAMSEVLSALEKTRLRTWDVEVLREHYAKTLAEWQRRFQAMREQVVEKKGEQFCRMWEFYLAASENSFRWSDLVVFQFQLSPSLVAGPKTRDYLYRQPTLEPQTANARSRKTT